jgi:hypothetical protein
VYKLPLVLTKEQSDKILEFVEKFHDSDFFKTNSTGTGRKFCIVTKNNLVKEYFNSLMKEKYEQLGIFDAEEEPVIGVFIGTGIENSFVHKHKDPPKPGFNHVRLNFLVSKPEIGGNPIINDEEIEIQEGESWLNVADLWMHGSTTVKGNKKRIVLSIGALVPTQTVENKLKKFWV